MHIGANPDLAWTATVNRPDLIDTYRLVINPENAGQYRLDGQWRAFDVTTARIRVRAADGKVATTERPIRWSVHGPVLETKDGPVAIRYASMDEARGVETSLAMMKARSVAEARKLLEALYIPSTNRIFADRTGAIARFYVARMPARIDGPNWKGMLPGDDSRLIWTRFEPFSALPHIENPPEGWVTEANSSPFKQMGSASDPDPARYPARFGIETELTNRAQRATALMKALPSISGDELWAVKMDHSYAPQSHAALLRSMIVSAPLASAPAYAEAIALIKAWDLTLAPTNRSAALAILTMQPIGTALQLGQKPPELKDTLDAAILFLKRHHGRLDVPWSQVNQLQRDGVRKPMTGGPDVLRAASSEMDEKTGTLKTIVGDGLVIMAEWDRSGRQTVRSISPFGASGRPGTPHRTDQMEMFVAGKLKPVAMTFGEGLVRRYRPQSKVPLQ
jgi:penicillin amidase/acyl-homoserine-lactone acylase